MYALGYAISFAKEFEAKLYLLHVIEPVSTMFYLDASKAPPAVEAMTDIQNHAQRALEEVLSPEVRGAISTEYAIRGGAPFLEIIRYAKEIEANMIVCGTHGRTGLKHLIMGSVAENVVRKSPCPVLTVRHPEHKFEMPV
jgi:nucleotide-binding universal stress UspA family protein